MTFFHVDDNLTINDKWLAVPKKDRFRVCGFWTITGSWCAHNLTDGHVPMAWVEEHDADELAALLVEAKLWKRNASGFYFVDWDKYQPTRSNELARRKRNAERQARWRRNQASESEKTDD